MGGESRFARAGLVRKSTFYVLVIGKDVKKLAEARFKSPPDQKANRKSLQALVRDLTQLESSVREVVSGVGNNSNILDFHHALLTAAHTHLKALDDSGGQPDRADTWNPLYLAMRGWCERMKAIDLQTNPKGGDTTKALDLLWRNPPRDGHADDSASTTQGTAPVIFLSDHYIALRLREIEERPILRRPRIPLGLYVLELGMMYETAAILGAARPDCAESLVKFCVGRLDDRNKEMLLGQADFHMDKIRQSPGTALSPYIDLVMDLMYSNEAADERLEFIAKNAKSEKRREDAIDEMTLVFPWGIAFGCAFPQETKRLWQHAHQSAVPISFSQHQENVLEIAAMFVASNYPEQVDDLNLQAQVHRLQQGKSVADEWLAK